VCVVHSLSQGVAWLVLISSDSARWLQTSPYHSRGQSRLPEMMASAQKGGGSLSFPCGLNAPIWG
jgi:hypothetical protein